MKKLASRPRTAANVTVPPPCKKKITYYKLI